jgi:hypothetical protein
MGPSFVLTPDEIAAQAAMNPTVGEDQAATSFELVGWYCSKPNGRLILSDSDQTLFDAICRERWQVALLIHPTLGVPTKGAFVARSLSGLNGNGFLVGSAHELAWQELTAFPSEPAPVSESAPLPTESPPIVSTSPPALPSRDSNGAVLHDTPQPPAPVPVTMPQTGTLFGALPEAEQAPRKNRRWPMRLLCTAIILGILGAAAYFSRDYWLPQPPIDLMASPNRLGRVSFLWNAGVLNDQDRVTLVIDDGDGPLHTFHLNRATIHTGWFLFDSRPGPMTATMLAGDLSDTIALNVPAEPYLPDSGTSK